MQLQQSNIIEGNHYYAYGLKIAAISSVKLGDGGEGGLQNNYQYQGKYSELDADIGWNDFELRNYDPQTGRWVQQDPYQEYASPYVGMGNDPVNNTDPDGGGVLGLTLGLFTALTTSLGAVIGGDVTAATGGSFIKGAAIGAAIGFAAGYIPSLIGGGVGSSVSHAVSILNVSVHAVGTIGNISMQNFTSRSINIQLKAVHQLNLSPSHNLQTQNMVAQGGPGAGILKAARTWNITQRISGAIELGLGGPFDPLADILAGTTEIIGGGIALYQLINNTPVQPAIPSAKSLPWTPGVSPGSDWVWKGDPKSAPGMTNKGNWVNPKTGQSLNPDLNHPDPKGPHWGLQQPDGEKWDIYPDGKVLPNNR